MYTGLKHLHVLLVVLFVVTTLVKTILLFVNQEKFLSYRAKTKLPEIIITVLFLVTGIVMITLKSGHFHNLFWVKIGSILLAIPMSVIGFKKQAKAPALVGAFAFILIYGLAEMSSKKALIKPVEVETEKIGTVEHGKQLYNLNCVVCHGEQGDKNLGGAANLQNSQLTENLVKEMIQKGSKKMPAFGSLKKVEIEALTLYVKGLQK